MLRGSLGCGQALLELAAERVGGARASLLPPRPADPTACPNPGWFPGPPDLLPPLQWGRWPGEYLRGLSSPLRGLFLRGGTQKKGRALGVRFQQIQKAWTGGIRHPDPWKRSQPGTAPTGDLEFLSHRPCDAKSSWKPWHLGPQTLSTTRSWAHRTSRSEVPSETRAPGLRE